VADVEQHGARGVAHVGGVHPAAGQLPQQPAVDGAEGQFAVRGGDVRAGHVVEQPADLGAEKYESMHQAGAVLHHLGSPWARSWAHSGSPAPVLPDDGVVDGLAGAAVPQHRGLALVGDADGGDVAWPVQARLGQRLARRCQLGLPDLVGSCSTQPGCG
jgi:hypothetical protein